MSETATYQRPESFTVPEGGLASFLTATTGDWADDDNNPIPSSGIAQAKQAAEKLSEFGRYEDTYMVHAAEGETVIPTAIFDENPRLKESLFRQMREMGLEPESYVVGSDLNSINPVTGQPEFFFKKLFKGIKKAVKGVVKVFKKIAPIVLPIALAFTPLGPVYGAMVGSGLGSLIQGKSIGKSLKSALIAGAGAGMMTGLAGGFGAKAGTSFGEGFSTSVGNALSAPGARFAALGQGLTPGSNTDLFSTKYLSATPAEVNDPMKIIQTDPANLPALRDGAGNIIDPTGANSPVMRLPEARGLTTSANAPALSSGTTPMDANRLFGPSAYDPSGGVLNKASNLPMASVRADSLPLANTQPYVNPTLNPNSTATGGITSAGGVNTGAGESRNFLQRTGDYLTGGSPADVELMRKTAGDKYVAEMAARNITPTAAEVTAIMDKAGPSMLRRFGPSAAIGTGGFSLAGGFKTPEEEEIDLGPTGQELYDANPEKYGYMGDFNYLKPYNASSGYNDVYSRTMFAAKGGNAVAFPRRIGGISGPGTGTSDDVPAMLSDGEFVMTADAVRGAGGGNRQRGINNMYSMMRRFEGGLV